MRCLVLLLLSSGTAFQFAARRVPIPASRPALALLRMPAPQQQSRITMAMPPERREPAARPARIVAAALVSLLSAMSSPALAATRSASGGTATALKWGGVAALGALGYVFRRDQVPVLTETPVAASEQAAPDERGAARPAVASAEPASAVEASVPAAAATDDSALSSALFARMVQLQQEKEAAAAAAAAAEEEEVEALDDSSEEWGTGSTAVLEPPPPEPPSAKLDESLLDGPAAHDFPPGYPLGGGAAEAAEAAEAGGADFAPRALPAPSEEQVAMLRRMMGE